MITTHKKLERWDKEGRTGSYKDVVISAVKVESVVFRGISVGESTEVGESSIVAEFSGEVSFGGGVAEVDEQEGFGEANRVIDEGEVDLLVEDFQGVVIYSLSLAQHGHGSMKGESMKMDTREVIGGDKSHISDHG